MTDMYNKHRKHDRVHVQTPPVTEITVLLPLLQTISRSGALKEPEKLKQYTFKIIIN